MHCVHCVLDTILLGHNALVACVIAFHFAAKIHLKLMVFPIKYLRPLTQKRFLPLSLNAVTSIRISTRKQTLIETAPAACDLDYIMHTASINQHLFVYLQISEGKPMSIEAN